MLLKTKIIATNRTVEHKVQQAVLPTLSGEIGILPNHIPILTGLETGVVRLKIDGRWMPIIIVDGIAKVNNNELVLIYTKKEEKDYQIEIDMEVLVEDGDKIEAGLLQPHGGDRERRYRGEVVQGTRFK